MEPSMLPVDQVFEDLVAKARKLMEVRDKLEASDAAKELRDQHKANQIAQRFQWRPVQALVLVEEQRCLNCGSLNSLFRGFATEWKRLSDNSRRMTQTEGLDQSLPAGRLALPSTSTACCECLSERFL